MVKFLFNSGSLDRIQRIAADSQVHIRGELYSDSLGAATPEGPPGIDIWEGIMRYNIGLIVAGLPPCLATPNGPLTGDGPVRCPQI